MGSTTSATSSSFNPKHLGLSAPVLVSALILGLCATALARVNQRRIPPPPLSPTFIVMMENRNFTEVVGNTTDWSYFNNTLIPQGALVTNGFATGHPSIDNYFELTVGAPLTHDDEFAGHHPGRLFKNRNVVDSLNAAGKTWKAYVENLPNPSTASGPNPYEQHHNPFVYFKNVVDNPANLQNVVDFSQLAKDESSNSLPDYAFIVPNDCDDGAGEDAGQGGPCPAGNGVGEPQFSAMADTWLHNNVPGMLNSLGSDGLLIITWDESNNDRKHGGGRVATLLLGARVKPNYQQTTKNVYTQAGILRLMLQGLGAKMFPGGSRGAVWMGEFFQGAQM